jgi:ribose-phosphate pyrophosphokinase
VSILVVANEANADTARLIAEQLKAPFVPVTTTHFADSELLLSLNGHNGSLSDMHVIVVHTFFRSVQERFTELLLLCRLLKEHDARTITGVIPYLGYSRQDNGLAHQSVAAYTVDLLAHAGVTGILTVEAHNADAYAGCKIPVSSLSLEGVFERLVKQIYSDKQCTLIAPDAGGEDRVRSVAQSLQIPYVVYTKERYAPNATRLSGSLGICDTKVAVLIDDIIDTGSTLNNVMADLQHACPEITFHIIAAHGIFSAGSACLLERENVERIWIANTVPLVDCYSNVSVVDISQEIAQALQSFL